MKILFLSYYYYPPHFGGGLLHTIERLQEMVKRGHRVTVLTSGVSTGLILEQRHNYLIKRFLLFHSNSIFLRAINRLAFFIKATCELLSNRYDLIQFGPLPGINEFSSSLIGLFFIKLVHLKKSKALILYSLAESETDPFIIRGFTKKIRLSFFKQIDTVVVNSPLLYNDMRNKIGTNVKLILNGADDSTFKPDLKQREIIRNENNISNEAIVFIFIGTLSKRKGVDLLVDGFDELSNTYPEVHLWLIGPSSNQENQNVTDFEFESVLNKINQNPKIKSWGRIDNRTFLASLLAAGDIFVFPTLREGMPMAPLQAMASGMPLIISLIPGVTDIANIQDETGIFIKPGNKEDLVKAMMKLAADKNLRNQMGINSRKRIEQEFSWKKHVDNWENIYLGK
jgi:glycosyltransferase involved in cell wall biosynthesis